MELDSSIQISSEHLQQHPFDVIIAVSGYESRCTFLSSKINVSRISTRVVLAFQEKKDILYRTYNDKQFDNWNYSFYNVSAYDIRPLKEILDGICLFQPKDSLNILVDYSGMPKIWYKGIINYFLELEERLVHLRLWLSYSLSEYSRAQSNVGKKYFSIDPPTVKSDKPVALILGLGYEKGKAEELLRRLNADNTFIFYANPAIDERFVKDVFENNQTLFQQTREANLIKYPINDLNSINESLTNVCLSYRLNNQLVLAPIEPKPFTLMCYILAVRYPDIKIWEVHSLGDLTPYDRKAQGELLVYELEFTSEEVDYSD